MSGQPRWFLPTSPADVLRRTATRVGYCALPFLLLASADSHWGDGRLLRSFWFTFCVFVVPLAGLAVDLRLLRRTRRFEGSPDEGPT